MRILYFSMAYGPHDHRFLDALAGTSHDVFFLRLAKHRRILEMRAVPTRIHQIRWAGGRHAFRWVDVPRLVRDFRRVVAEVRPDLVHAGPIQSCAFLAALSGFRPILAMSWGFDLMQDADLDTWRKWITRFTLRRSTFFVSDAEVTRRKAVAFGMRAGRTAVFPWGVDLQKYRPRSLVRRRTASVKRRLVTNERRPNGPRSGSSPPLLVLCNRSWEPRYGVDVLARGFVEVVQRHENVHLSLLGGGSQARLIRGILADGGVLDRVQFGGQVAATAMAKWYRQADIFVSPSHVDGSSVSLMEALATGLPTLVSDIPANKEWIRDGVNGWLFRDGDATHLADKLVWLSKHTRERQRAGREARRVAKARADWRKNFRVLLRSYEEATKAHRGD